VRTIAVVNQKGGVAKTTTVRNLAVALKHEGQRVLMVDLDPQANLTTSSGVDLRSLRGSIYNVLVHKKPMSDVIQHTREGLDVAPADEVLMRAEMEMGDQHLGWVRELRKALDPIRGNYDVCLIDTPPIRGFLTVNALVAAQHGVIIPFVPERDSIRGMQLLLGRIGELLPANPGLRPIACVPAMMDKNWRTHADNLAELTKRMPDLPFTQPIYRHADFPKSAALCMSIFDYAPKSQGAQAYRDLAHMVLRVADAAPAAVTA
jgi:chromosome partitioning protein